jgi:hypothetical protein
VAYQFDTPQFIEVNMLDTFLATLSPMLSLFLFIAIGFVIKKMNILPEGSGKVLAKQAKGR